MDGSVIVTDIVKSHRRCVKQIVFNNFNDYFGFGDDISTSPAFIGITGSSFDPDGTAQSAVFVQSITGSSAKISRISWSLDMPENGAIAVYFVDQENLSSSPEPFQSEDVAVYLTGNEGEIHCDKFTINQKSLSDPYGAIYLTDASGNEYSINGVVNVEFVL